MDFGLIVYIGQSAGSIGKQVLRLTRSLAAENENKVTSFFITDEISKTKQGQGAMQMRVVYTAD